HLMCVLFSVISGPPPHPPLFPYTTLFRSRPAGRRGRLDDRAKVTRAFSTQRVSGGPRCSGARRDPSGREREGAAERPRLCHRDRDRKSTRLNSSHEWISYAVFCLKKKNTR